MNIFKINTLGTADAKAMELGAVKALDHRLVPGDEEVVTTHYFLPDGTEVAMYHPMLYSFRQFCPPRVWDQGIYEATGKPRDLQGRVEVSTLEGELLDYAVAKAECVNDAEDITAYDSCYSPSTNPEQGLPIIEQNHIEWKWLPHEPWVNQVGARLAPFYGPDRTFCMRGPTILVAAMRCFVASKLGDFVHIPKELLK